MLTQQGVPFTAWELDQRADWPAIQAALLHKTGQRTVPNIFIHQKHLGGASDLEAAIESGKLRAMLAADSRTEL
jgi:glutaredoxin 3